MNNILSDSLTNTFALIQPIDSSVGGDIIRHECPKLNGSLNNFSMMEDTFCIVTFEAISGPVTVVEDKLFSQSTKILSC